MASRHTASVVSRDCGSTTKRLPPKLKQCGATKLKQCGRFLPETRLTQGLHQPGTSLAQGGQGIVELGDQGWGWRPRCAGQQEEDVETEGLPQPGQLGRPCPASHKW